jgi:hypothetical protein
LEPEVARAEERRAALSLRSRYHWPENARLQRFPTAVYEANIQAAEASSGAAASEAEQSEAGQAPDARADDGRPDSDLSQEY